MTLHCFKVDLGRHGLEQGMEIEIYNVRHDVWRPLRWDEQFGYIQIPNSVFLIWVVGVRILRDFDSLSPFASHLPIVLSSTYRVSNFKGKARAV